MTGYAVTTRETDAGTLTVELKSVNSRFLDLQFRINDEFRAFEPVLREAIMARVNRGKVECRLSFGRKATTGGVQNLNAELLDALSKMQAQVKQHFPDAPALTVSELLRWPGVIADAEASQEALQAEVQALINDALGAFIDSRAREGAALQAMLISRIDEMEAIVQRITPLIPQAIAQFQQKATERMKEALGVAASNGGPATVSREEALERIRQEVTLYGIRIDVAEELSRLSAHLSETRHILKKGGQVGKRLDFMMQELNREANTVGSKAALKELSDASMAMKLLIEQMREQVQNLE
ncbi:YicC/YloC family endoribonuclease [Noviherbaspirillum sp.]|uniref:YicC/YloC family endoribonuclease n=1 Tax=Noviherbaspirillum sp. TaxID=1926288 RepID=UPI002D249FE3|nr:YicC/YloC family endoribonuclease [Noviherbaspirillum sp.]HZW20690.1 YicC/YloC family endoribonuclease [Noviherbaspirillum sp.]